MATRTAGAAGSIQVVTKNLAGQLITPVSVPVVKWYTDAGRTLGELTLPTTGSGSTYTSTWTAAQAPPATAKRYLLITIEVSTGVYDIDANDHIDFVDASASIDATYLTVADVRALPNLSDSVKYSDAALTAAIDWFEATFEDYCGVAFVPRTVTDERHYVTSSGSLILNHTHPRTISAVRLHTTSAASTLFTASELADLRLDSTGVVRRVSLGRFTSTYGIIGIDYSHGYDAPFPDVVEAAKVAVSDRLLNRDPTRQFSVATEAGVVRNSTPGERTPFGIQFVDEVANRRRERVPAVA